MKKQGNREVQQLVQIQIVRIEATREVPWHCGQHWTLDPAIGVQISVEYFSYFLGFPGGTMVENLPANVANAEGVGSVPQPRRSPGEGNVNSLQHSCQENPMDSGTWWASVHGVTKSWTGLSMHTSTHKDRGKDLCVSIKLQCSRLLQ